MAQAVEWAEVFGRSADLSYLMWLMIKLDKLVVNVGTIVGTKNNKTAKRSSINIITY